MRDPDSSDLDALLRGAAPMWCDAADEQRIFAAAWTRVQSAMDDTVLAPDDLTRRRLDLIADRDLAARRRRRSARIAAVTVAVAMAGAGTAAAAEFISTRTGQHNSGWEISAGGSGELLDLGGTDLRQVVEESTADIPFPEGYETLHDKAVDSYGPDPGSGISENYLRTGIAGYAVCTWADAWVAADDSGDTTARAQATETLTEAVTWEPFVTFAEDHAEVAEERQSWLPRLADAARSGDRQGVLDAVADSYTCGYEYVPTIDADPAYRWHGLPR